MSSVIISQDFYTLTGIRLGNSSFLNMFNILKDDDGIMFMNIFRAYEIDQSVFADVLFFTTYEVENDDWWDNISYKAYDIIDLWWSILLMNNIKNPFEDLNIGDNLKILKNDFMPQLLKELHSVAEK